MSATKLYSYREERANALSHLLGFFLVFLSSFFVVPALLLLNDFWAYFAYVVMYFGILSSYAASFFYHSQPQGERKVFLRKFDHAAIYLNIAGSYTPYSLYLLRDTSVWGWIIFGVIWGCALLGVALTFRTMKRNSHLKTLLYLAMGWIVVLVFKPMLDALGDIERIEVIYWLIAEGVFFTVGALFYMFAKREFMHALWHLFVVAGSLAHLYSVYLLIR